MKYMTSTEIREMWYKFFVSKNHKKELSAPLIPINDDSLLWINAGVAPLKKYFDGSSIPDNRRIVNIQKCIRTNDIENVGLTKRHQTFFEMMGNFSIGDYFKEEAIEFAFELLTSKEWFDIPKEKLYVTVYTSDQEAYDKWVSLGFIEDHIIKLDGNFWEIGEGPCGPDSEIFFDRGEKYDSANNALELFKNDEEQERYIEIWNNVFSQFNSKPGVKREDYKELPSKNIDTGAGLERWACIFQDADSNFDTDLFKPLINKLEEISGVLYNGEMPFKVIADHIRAITAALSDGAIFENNGRGYVLRRLLRRSVRMGKKIGINEPFMYNLVDTVCAIMGESYPEMQDNQAFIKTLVYEEEELFHKTLSAGERRLLELIEENTKTKKISGIDAFKLYDTYGFPFELTLEYLEEKNYTTSKEEFDKCMEEQKMTAKKARHQETSMNSQNEALMKFTNHAEFVYEDTVTKGKVIGLFKDKKSVDAIKNQGYVILDKTCFYAESGGQISDTGMIIGKNFKARVLECTKAPNKQNLLKVRILDGEIKVGDTVTSNIDIERREKIARNHSSVHLLQYALRTIISDTIKQAGSRVDDQSLRFDFTYTGKLLDDEIVKVEDLVNSLIEEEQKSSTQVMSVTEAKESGALALFSEKYGDEVRVVTIGPSKELCGGTHVHNTGEIKSFAISNVESKGSNVYRIEAVTGNNITGELFERIKPYNDEKVKLLMKAKNIILKAKQENIVLEFDIDIVNEDPKSYKDIIFEKNELEYVQTEVRNLEKKYKDLKNKNAIDSLSEYDKYLEKQGKLNVIVFETENEDIPVLKNIMDQLANKYDNSVVFVINKKDDSSAFLVKSTSNIDASTIIKEVAQMTNGNGGGSKTFAQGGSKNKIDTKEVLNRVKEFLK